MNSHNNSLTSSEISNLWNSYTFVTMLHHIMSYFMNSSDDKDIKTFFEYACYLSRVHLDEYTSVFIKEGLPVPRGTISEDVDVNAPKLFSDKFHIYYGDSLSKYALSNYALAYTESSRYDIRKLYRDKIISLQELHQFATDVMISKNNYPRPPIINILPKVEFVENEDFFSGFWGEKRPLTSFSVKQLFNNLINNSIGKTLMTGFSQVSKSKEVQEYLIKGKEIADKYIRLFTDKLLDEDIIIPSMLESEILPFSGSQVQFSDRFMLNHTVFLNAFGVGNYGFSLAQSQRRDLQAMYAKIIVEVGVYTDKGADLLIKNKWFEQPPLVLRRQDSTE